MVITPSRRRRRPSCFWVPLLALVATAGSSAFLGAHAQVEEPAPPRQLSLTYSNGLARMTWQPLPAAELYRLYRGDTLGLPFGEDPTAAVSGFQGTSLASGPAAFFRVGAMTMDSNALLTATLLNRLAYGPTPDELERVRAIGPQAYIDEQLAPELIVESLDIDQVLTNNTPDWQRFTATGTASSSTVYVYLNAPGEGYIDDLALVAGTNADAGANLIRNGDFESPLTTNDWTISANLGASGLSAGVRHSGSGSLHLVASSAGQTQGSSIWQVLTGVTNNARYTLSYWYLASTNTLSSPTVRLSGSGIVSAPLPLTLGTRLAADAASLDDLRAWHVLHGLRSRRQLLEILDQFLENHFVTQHAKSSDFLNTYYDDGNQIDRLATRMEYTENRRWRAALLDPQCTFHDLLRISAESPAMILYLDTVSSRGDRNNVANENYARELFELFCQGVDNGYDQADIVEMSKLWTGWRLRLVDATNEFNPLAAQSTTLLPGSTNTSLTTISNLVGVWAFNYQADRHNTNTKTLFASTTGGKTIPPRFGPPYTTRTYGTNTTPGVYQLVIPGRTGNDGLQEGYEALAYVADLPFTQEYLSVKLCRLFVHDDFPNPSNDPANPAYAFYDYTSTNLTEEAQLVRACMRAWDNGTPGGQLRDVLRVIFDSALFRSHGASMQKVKTPLEFTLSALRALRTANTNGAFTADTDGYSLATPLSRMGGMVLFNRSDPDGYPETAPGWISAGTLAERLRFVQALCIATNQTGHTDAGNSACHPAALLSLKLPGAAATDAGAVADYLLDLLFPAEGRANLDLYRSAAIRYLNTSDDGRSPSPFATLSTTGNPSPYEIRVRGLTALILSAPRFQEQ
jgi:uncharacterized protein (DUF1800 family)